MTGPLRTTTDAAIASGRPRSKSGMAADRLVERALRALMRTLAAALAVLVSMAVPTVARAQQGNGCAWSLGMAGNLSPAGRDWDLSTPAGSWSLTPVASQQCAVVDEWTNVRPWVGLDVVPFLQHRYASLGERGTLGMLANAGFTIRMAPWTSVGGHVLTNGTAVGLGARAVWLRPPRNRFAPYGIETRLQFMPGSSPDFQAMVLLHFHHRWVGEFSEAEHVDPHRQRGKVAGRMSTGFEIGPLLAWRGQITLGRAASARGTAAPELGVRIGVLTNPFADAAVQPIGLVELDIQPWIDIPWFDVATSAGVTRRDGIFAPAGGVAGQIDVPESSVQVHLGVLVGGGDRFWGSIDTGVGWVW